MSIRRNSLYNLAGALAPIAVTLLTLPTYIRVIGEERFAVLSIAWVLLGYFGLFDLGLTQATSQRIAKLRDAEPAARTETFWTALALNTGFGVFGGMLLWPVAHIFFASHFQVDEVIRREILAALPWLIAAVPLTTVSGVLGGALQGRERFLALNVINVSGAILFQLIPLVAAWWLGAKLQFLLPSVVMVRLFTMAMLAYQARKHLPIVGRPRVNRTLVGPLFRFGGWVTVSGIIGPLMVSFDRMLIGALVGARAVTHYTIPYELASRVLIIPTSLTSALFPRLAAVAQDERRQMSGEAVRVLLVLITPAIVGGMLIMEPFLGWWLNEEFASPAAPVGQVILLGLWGNAFARIPYVELQAKGRPDLVAKAHVAEILPYALLLYLGLVQWGIMGAAIAWSLRALADVAILFRLSGAGISTASRFLSPGAIVLAAYIAALFVPQGSAVGFGLSFAILLLSLGWAYQAMPESLRKMVPHGNRLWGKSPAGKK